MPLFERRPGRGWLALLGGGEFSFGETQDADRAWLAHCGPGPVGFVPAASGSNDYPRHFAAYLRENFAREVETMPIYRPRDARRGRNAERLREVAAVYLGGGVTDHLLEALAGSPAGEALNGILDGGPGAPEMGAGGVGAMGAMGAMGGMGGMVVAIAAAAQAAGVAVRSIAPGRTLAGFGWLPEGVVEPNFDPDHDRRLRRLLAGPGVRWGVGLPPGSALLLGPEGAVEIVGTIFRLGGADDELEVLGDESEEMDAAPETDEEVH